MSAAHDAVDAMVSRAHEAEFATYRDETVDPLAIRELALDLKAFAAVARAAADWRAEAWLCECEATGDAWHELVERLRGTLEKALDALARRHAMRSATMGDLVGELRTRGIYVDPTNPKSD